MSKKTPKVSITQKTVDAAIKRAAAGEDGEILDAACKGLTLRLRGGIVAWTLRRRWAGKRKRFIIDDGKTAPDTARERALIVKRCCHEGVNPKQQIVEWTAGVPVYKQDAKGPKSISWEAGRKLILDHVFAKRAEATAH
jgi:hypothetical protein